MRGQCACVEKKRPKMAACLVSEMEMLQVPVVNALPRRGRLQDRFWRLSTPTEVFKIRGGGPWRYARCRQNTLLN